LLRPAKAALAALLALMVLVSAALSVSPELHHRLHSDSADRAHQCAVTLFSQHQILLDAPAAAFLFFAAALFFWLPLYQAPVLARVDSRLAPSRAPPVLL
jgi:hypothetical protein